MRADLHCQSRVGGQDMSSRSARPRPYDKFDKRLNGYTKVVLKP
jgi:hypothetical protein